MPEEIDYDKLAKLTYVGWQFDCPVCHGTQEISDHDPQLLAKIVCLYCKNELTVFQKYQKIDLSKEKAPRSIKLADLTWAELVKDAHETQVKLNKLKREIRRAYRGISGKRMSEENLEYVVNDYKKSK